MPDHAAARLHAACVTMHRLFRDYGWLLLAASCLVLGYLLVWQRGPYFDDHAFRSIARDEAAGQWQPVRGIQYCLHIVTRLHVCLWNVHVAALLPDYELWIRAGVALMVGVNSLLLGLLLYRVLRSRLAAVVCGWLLMPFWAPEAMLWATVTQYTSEMTVALIFLHAAVSIGGQTQQWRRWALVAVLCLVAPVFSIEQFMTLLVLAPFLALAQAAQGEIPSYRQALRRTAALLVPLLVGAAVITLVVYARDATYVPGRGTFDFGPAGIL